MFMRSKFPYFLQFLAFSFGCPLEWNVMPNEDVCVYTIGTAQFYWDTTRDCANFGGMVVKIQNAFENAYIGSLIPGLPSAPFIGVERKSNGTWLYQDGTPLTYTNWAPGEQNANSSLNCVKIGGQNLQWYAADCSIASTAFCSLVNAPAISTQSSTSTIATTAQTGNDSQCLDGWIYFNETNYCYYLHNFTRQEYTWWEGYSYGMAGQNCRKMTAELASIHSDAENDFIYDLIYANVANLTYVVPAGYDPCDEQWAWIGLYANSTLGQWNDNSPFDFIDWNPRNGFYAWYNWIVSNDPSCKRREWQPTSGRAYARYICKRPSNQKKEH